jgi:hypothetical protein
MYEDSPEMKPIPPDPRMALELSIDTLSINLRILSPVPLI